MEWIYAVSVVRAIIIHAMTARCPLVASGAEIPAPNQLTHPLHPARLTKRFIGSVQYEKKKLEHFNINEIFPRLWDLNSEPQSFMKPSEHNNDKGEQKIRTINLNKKAVRASAGQIVREISKGPGARRTLDGTLYDGPLSKPAHYVGLKDRPLEL